MHIFDIYAKNFHAESCKIQYVVISLNFEDKKKRKNVVQNLLRRSREMKVCIKNQYLRIKTEKMTVCILFRVRFTKEMYCYFQLLYGGSAHIWLCLRLYILFLNM